MENQQSQLNLNKNKRVRFTPQDDLIFLREVLSINPLEDRGRWATLQEVFNEKTMKVCTIRALKEHLDLLLKKFLIKDEKNKTMTGIEEPYNEMDHLLQQINEILKEVEINNVKKSLNTSTFFAKESIDKGKIIRKSLLDQFKKYELSEVQLDIPAEPPDGEALTHTYDDNDENMQTLESTNNYTEKKIVSQNQHKIQKRTANSKIRNKTETILTPNKSRTPKRLKNSALEFIQIKSDKENFIKNKELDLEECKLKLEEKKIQIEEKKLAHQIDMDKKKLELEAIKVKMEQNDKKKLHEIIEKYQMQTDLLLKKINT